MVEPIRSAPPSRPPRLALLHWALPPTVGGVESHLGDYAALLAAAGWRVTVVTGEPDPAPIDGVEILTHPALHLSGRGAAAGDRDRRRFQAWLGAALAERSVRLVHAHNLHHFTPVPAAALARLRRPLDLRLLHTYHGVWPGPPCEAAALVRSSFDAHFAVSEYVRRGCLRHLRLTAHRSYLGIEPERFRHVPPAAPSGDRGRVLLPARLIPDKGADLAVLMLARLRDRGIKARLVLTDAPDVIDWLGEQPGYRARLLGLIGRLGLREQVEITSAPFSGMDALYAEADVVVYPSAYPEPLGLAPLEAMCAGRPAVASRIGGLPEVVRDGVTGYLVPPGDPAALADRVELLLTDRPRALRMGRAGRHHVLRHFDLRRYARRMDAFYRLHLGAARGRDGAPLGPAPPR